LRRVIKATIYLKKRLSPVRENSPTVEQDERTVSSEKRAK